MVHHAPNLYDHCACRLAANRFPNVSIRVIPYDSPAAMFTGAFVYFEFDGTRPPVVAIEYQGGDALANGGEREVRRYRRQLDFLADHAMPMEESREYMANRWEQ